MSVSSVTSSGLPSGANAPPPNPSGLGKEDFLKLLVAQLATQNPMEPMQGTEFVTQLATFSSLEQLAGMNHRLDALAMGQAGLISGQSVNLIGRTVVYAGKEVTLEEGAPAPLAFDLATSAASVEITVKNERGEVVRTMNRAGLGSGRQEQLWDGLADDGEPAPGGAYTFEVKATDADGQPVASVTWGRGKVSGLTFKNGFPELLIGTTRIPPAAILEIVD